jgi:8-oxo-dGTP pyrophosphatase MutT (NUDIX family)
MALPTDDWRSCPRCGGNLVRADDHVRCGSCGLEHFPNMGVGAAVVIRNAGGQVLMVQRSARQYGAGRWCFPCGYVEWGEDVREAARREAREEASIDVVIGDPVWVETNLHQPDKPTVGIWFAATMVDPATTPVAGDDAVGVGWFDPAAPPPLAFPTDATLLARIARTDQTG